MNEQTFILGSVSDALHKAVNVAQGEASMQRRAYLPPFITHLSIDKTRSGGGSSADSSILGS